MKKKIIKICALVIGIVAVACLALILICNQIVVEQQGQVSVSPNKEERLKIDNYEEVIISSHK